MVKFQQYDNYMITTDGMAFDDISVTAGAAGIAAGGGLQRHADLGHRAAGGDLHRRVHRRPTSWSWTFGDGGTSTAQNPSHTYTAAGTYTVTLTASNAFGSDGETKTNYITVTDPVGGGDWVTSPTTTSRAASGNYTDGGGDCCLYTGGTLRPPGQQRRRRSRTTAAWPRRSTTRPATTCPATWSWKSTSGSIAVQHGQHARGLLAPVLRRLHLADRRDLGPAHRLRQRHRSTTRP